MKMDKGIACGAVLLSAACTAATVTVDFTKETGPIRPLNGVNNAPVRIMDYGCWRGDQKEFARARIPFMRTHDTFGMWGGKYVDIPNVFPNFDADENDPANYDFAFTDAYLKPVVAAGTEIFYRLGVTIENYAKVKAYNIYPPKDFAKWARICEHVVRHYNEGWANGFKWNIRYWEVWCEPEQSCLWLGTREQYFDLYRTTANHLKKLFPNIRIGGYGCSGFYALDDNRPKYQTRWMKGLMTDWFEGFCRYVTDEKTKAPLDFFSWHLYFEDGRRVDSIATHADYVRRTLDRFGLTASESVFDEWNQTAYGPTGMQAIQGAAFAGAAFAVMQRAPIDLAMFYDALPTRRFCGLFKFPSEATTPMYEVFLYYNELRTLGMSVESATDADGTYVLAAKNAAGEKAILVSRAYPPQTLETAAPKVTLGFDLKGAALKDFRLRRLDVSHKRTYDATFDPTKGIDINSHGVVFLETKAK